MGVDGELHDPRTLPQAKESLLPSELCNLHVARTSHNIAAIYVEMEFFYWWCPVAELIFFNPFCTALVFALCSTEPWGPTGDFQRFCKHISLIMK